MYIFIPFRKIRSDLKVKRGVKMKKAWFNRARVKIFHPRSNCFINARIINIEGSSDIS